ncbi:MAG: DNA-protecting protein DprA [Chloroflexi bacterium]|nr:DNA-protecting protein DprA [Chloroflexota bacterium]
MDREERAAWVALSRVRGIGPARFRKMLDHFEHARHALLAGPDAWRSLGLREDVIASLTQAARELPQLIQQLDAWQRAGIRVLTWRDTDYPNRLRDIPHSPPVLYMRGEWRLDDDWAVAVVGTRKMTRYGRQVAQDVVDFLVQHGITVVSGLARGIDGVAHRRALEAGGRTLAVLGSGVDVIYPPEHRALAQAILERNQGALLSEYPPGTRPDAANFPPRNRIIAGLSLAVVVVEAGEKSGALITARFAAELGRDVFAVPGSIYVPTSQGTLWLIQQGAQVLRRPEDLASVLDLRLLPQRRAARAQLPTDPIERQLWEALRPEPLHIDDLCARTGLPAARVSAILAIMELKGLVRQVGPMTYQAREG